MKIKHLLPVLFCFQCFGLETNVVKFFIHPDVVTNYALIQTNLPKYVQDVNHILSKNTIRRWKFDPDTGIIVTATPPHDQIEPFGGAPTSGYEIWVWVRKTTQSLSFGGSISIDSTGAAVLIGGFWTTFYNPDILPLGSDAFEDYWTQITIMLHEYGHVSGAGISVDEYYDYTSIVDDTGVLPNTPMEILTVVNGQFVFNHADQFWGRHGDFESDPLLRQLPSQQLPYKGRQDMLDNVRYSDLTAGCINGPYRIISLAAPLPSLTGLRLIIRDELTCLPLEGARVRIYRINDDAAQIPTALLVDTVTGTNGEVIWNWNIQGGGQFLSFDPVRLVKVERVGYERKGHYIGGIDLQQIRVLEGQVNVTNSILMTRPKLRLLPVTTNQVVQVMNCIPGKMFTVYVSENLVAWYPVVTNIPTTTNIFRYTNSAWLGFPKLFYVAKEPADEFCYSLPQFMMAQGNPPLEESYTPARHVRKEVPIPPIISLERLKKWWKNSQ